MKDFIVLINIFVIMVTLVVEPVATASINFFIKIMLLKIIIISINLIIIYLINKKKGGIQW
jgi:hypothetical protein